MYAVYHQTACEPNAVVACDQARDPVVAVVVGPEDATVLDSPRHDVMQGFGTVEASGAGHTQSSTILLVLLSSM